MPLNGGGTAGKPAGTTAVPNTTIASTPYNSVIDDIYNIFNTPRPVVYGGTGAADAAGARTNLGLTTGTFGFLYGLTLSNNATDATNDIDISVGTAAEQDVANPTLMTLASAITKRLDAAWAVGSGNGGLDTGSIANTTYHVWLIQRSDTSVVDVLFSTSATAPTMPANYDRKRRIGSIIRESTAIVRFYQTGDVFLREPSNSTLSTAAIPSTSATIGVPGGIAVRPILAWQVICGASANVATFVGSFARGSANTQLQSLNVPASSSAADISTFDFITTGTSSQIYIAQVVASGTITQSVLITNGWIDSRGK